MSSRAAASAHAAAVAAGTLHPDSLKSLASHGPPDHLGAKGATARRPLAVSFCPAGHLLAVACDDGAVQVWDMETLAPCLEVVAHSRAATGVAWLGGGELLASAGADGAVAVWSLASLTEVCRVACDGAIVGLRARPSVLRASQPGLGVAGSASSSELLVIRGFGAPGVIDASAVLARPGFAAATLAWLPVPDAVARALILSPTQESDLVQPPSGALPASANPSPSHGSSSSSSSSPVVVSANGSPALPPGGPSWEPAGGQPHGSPPWSSSAPAAASTAAAAGAQADWQAPSRTTRRQAAAAAGLGPGRRRLPTTEVCEVVTAGALLGTHGRAVVGTSHGRLFAFRKTDRHHSQADAAPCSGAAAVAWLPSGAGALPGFPAVSSIDTPARAAGPGAAVLVVLTADGAPRLVDSTTLAELAVLRDPVGMVPTSCVAVSGDGQLLATGAWLKGHHTVTLWRCTGALVGTLAAKAEMPVATAWHPYRGVLVTATAAGALMVWGPGPRERWAAFAPHVREIKQNRLLDRAAAGAGAGHSDEQEGRLSQLDKAQVLSPARPAPLSPQSSSPSSALASGAQGRAHAPAAGAGRAAREGHPGCAPAASGEVDVGCSAPAAGRSRPWPAGGGGAGDAARGILTPMARTTSLPPAAPMRHLPLLLRGGQQPTWSLLTIDGSAAEAAAVRDPADAAVAAHAKALAEQAASRSAAPAASEHPPAVRAAIASAGMERRSDRLADAGVRVMSHVMSGTATLESALAAASGIVGVRPAPP